MRASIVSFLTSACLAAGMAHANAAADHIAIFKNVDGGIDVVRDGATLSAAPGDRLYLSDQLQSAAGATAGIVFKDGTLLTVGPSSHLRIRDYVYQPREAKYAFSLYLDKGSAIYSSGQIGKLAPEAVRVDSPTASVGVRGTRFIIRAE